jgi:nucleoside-diphosphate-sugar epimerase
VIKVALTGTTGFIGNVLLSRLITQGFQVKALYRPKTSFTPQNSDSVEWCAGDLADLRSLSTFVAGADVIVHCAGSVRGTSLKQFNQTNSSGLIRLLDAAVEQNVSRFVLMSSLAAREPSLSAYAASKKAGEDALVSYLDTISCAVLRPPAVYGPGDREMLPLLKMIKRGIVPILGNQQDRFSLIYVDDLADAVCCLLMSKNIQKYDFFELHDGSPDGYTWRQIAEIATYINGKEPLCLSIPKSLMQIIALANLGLARLFGYQPMLTPGKIREIFHPDWTCDNSAITAATGWKPRVLFSDGMKRLFDQ